MDWKARSRYYRLYRGTVIGPPGHGSQPPPTHILFFPFKHFLKYLIRVMWVQRGTWLPAWATKGPGHRWPRSLVKPWSVAIISWTRVLGRITSSPRMIWETGIAAALEFFLLFFIFYSWFAACLYGIGHGPLDPRRFRLLGVSWAPFAEMAISVGPLNSGLPSHPVVGRGGRWWSCMANMALHWRLGGKNRNKNRNKNKIV